MSERAPARDHVSVDQLAQQYGISRAWIYGEAREGRLPHLRFGRRIVVSKRESEEHARRAAESHVGFDPEE